jgi:AraC-like DNA-binding protein
VIGRAPGNDLVPFVRSLWVEEVAAESDPLPPSTAARLLVDLADGGRVVVAGPRSDAGELPRDPGVRRCGVDLTSAGLPAFTATPASAFADRVEDAAPHLPWSDTWPARLAAAASSDDILEVLQQLLRALRRPSYSVDARVARAARHLDAEPDAPVTRVAREAGLTDSGFRRLFARGTGLSPRAYAAIARAVAGHGAPSRVR